MTLNPADWCFKHLDAASKNQRPRDFVVERRITTAGELHARLKKRLGHVIRRGVAPEGWLEVWPDEIPEIWLISMAEYCLLDHLCDEISRNPGPV